MRQNKIKIVAVILIMVTVLVITGVFSLKTEEAYIDNTNETVTELTEEIVKEPTFSSVVTDADDLLSTQQEAVLQKYALSYAKTLVYLEPQDISEVYVDTETAEYHLNKTAFQVIATVRGMADKDLTLEDCQVEYIIKDAYTYKGKTYVSLQENNIQKFKFLYSPSKNFIIQHEFVIEEIDGEWRISMHYQEEDFYLLVAEYWEKQIGLPSEISDKVLKNIIADTEENILWKKENYLNKSEEKTAIDTGYDREAAVKYAESWVGERNYTGVYLAYDPYGGNCQNFASQCLHAGGLAMDYKGYSQWKFYSKTLNEYATASGRSYSWTGVEPFFNYCRDNTSGGIVAHTDWGIAYAEKGDVIQVGAMGRWRHSIFVTDVVYDENGYAEEIIVASNTADRLNYPLSAYIYTAPRLIHIVGQN